MTNSLRHLFEAIADASDEQALRLHFMEAAGKHFDAHYWGLCLLNEQSHLAEVHLQGGANIDAFADQYDKIGRPDDPIFRYVMEHHAPVHEAMILSPENWKQSELYQNCYAQYDHEHVMMGPLVNGGQMIGGVYFARASDAPAFDFQDLANLSGLCLHLSARLATLRAQPTQTNSPTNPAIADRLTERELQIAQLVAQGLTNAEIGKKLWITQNTVKQTLKRIFRKLDVSARTELVARLREVPNP